jgi:hypothetical protein
VIERGKEETGRGPLTFPQDGVASVKVGTNSARRGY